MIAIDRLFIPHVIFFLSIRFVNFIETRSKAYHSQMFSKTYTQMTVIFWSFICLPMEEKNWIAYNGSNKTMINLFDFQSKLEKKRRNNVWNCVLNSVFIGCLRAFRVLLLSLPWPYPTENSTNVHTHTFPNAACLHAFCLPLSCVNVWRYSGYVWFETDGPTNALLWIPSNENKRNWKRHVFPSSTLWALKAKNKKNVQFYTNNTTNAK